MAEGGKDCPGLDKDFGDGAKDNSLLPLHFPAPTPSRSF